MADVHVIDQSGYIIQCYIAVRAAIDIAVLFTAQRIVCYVQPVDQSRDIAQSSQSVSAAIGVASVAAGVMTATGACLNFEDAQSSLP